MGNDSNMVVLRLETNKQTNTPEVSDSNIHRLKGSRETQR